MTKRRRETDDVFYSVDLEPLYDELSMDYDDIVRDIPDEFVYCPSFNYSMFFILMWCALGYYPARETIEWMSDRKIGDVIYASDFVRNSITKIEDLIFEIYRYDIDYKYVRFIQLSETTSVLKLVFTDFVHYDESKYGVFPRLFFNTPSGPRR